MANPPTIEPSDDVPDFESNPLGDARRPADPASIQHAQSGDREALTALWRQHAPHIVRLFQAQRVTNADEVAAQVWSDIGHSIKRFVGDGQAFRRWVLLVASTHARVARPVSDTDADETRDLAETDRDDATIAGAVATMASLPPDTAEAVMLRHVHGLSIADIAEITGDAPGDVRLSVHNGTKRLRKVLSVVDDEGVIVEPGTEWSLTDRLREHGTPAEFANETRQVDMVVASMDTAGAARAAAAGPPRKRRAAAAVAASLLILVGGGVLLSLEINESPASGLASVDSLAGPSGGADVRRLPETPNVQPGQDLAEATSNDVTSTSLDSSAVVSNDDASVATSGDDATSSNDETSNDTPTNNNNNNSGTRAPTPTEPPPIPAAGPPVPGDVPVTATPTTTPSPAEPINIPIPSTTRPTANIPIPSTTPATTRPPTTTPATTPATTRLPTTTPATTRPTVTSPPVTSPPVTSPPTTQPPVTAPPTTQPPVTSPPTTQPPITAPPTTRPTITVPPTTRPPITVPATTQPAVTQPTVTSPAPDDDDDDDDDDGPLTGTPL